MADKVLVPNFKIVFNGTELDEDAMRDVSEVIVDEEINLPSMFIVKLKIADFFMKDDSEGLAMKDYKIGSTAKISLGAAEIAEIIDGEIVSMEATFKDKTPTAEIRGYDKMHRLRFGTKSQSFLEKKDSEIVKTVASDAGLTPTVDATTTAHPYVFQNNQSDYSFLLERADRLGYEMLMQDGKFLFRKPVVDKEKATTDTTVTFGKELKRFKLRVSVLADASTVEARGWDVTKKEAISGEATKGKEFATSGGTTIGHSLISGLTSPTLIADTVIEDAAEAKTVAEGRYNRSIRHLVEGEGTLVGDLHIRYGKTMEIQNIGEKYSGLYYVTKAVHTISRTAYKINFKVRKIGI